VLLPAAEGRGKPCTLSPHSGDPVPASTLSPTTKPFFLGVASADHAMVSRWMDYSDDDDIDEVIDAGEVVAASQTPFLDAVRRGPPSKPGLRSIVVQPPPTQSIPSSCLRLVRPSPSTTTPVRPVH
jgi:hypothetical protein